MVFWFGSFQDWIMRRSDKSMSTFIAWLVLELELKLEKEMVIEFGYGNWGIFPV